MAAEKLAQYFTPQPVAAFALDALRALGLSLARPRVIDPACGEGVFLVEARRRFPEAELWGCEVDGTLAQRWRAAGLCGPRVHLLVQDGLVDAPWYGLRSGGFDVVVGNPPYGLGLARPRRGEPIEVQFVRRFVELARPGGWLAMVVPEGIVANSRCQRLRDGLLGRLALRAVVGLPEAAFAHAGTAARTVVLLAQRRRGAAGNVVMIPAPPSCRGEHGLAAYLGGALRAIRGNASDVPARGRRGTG